MAWRLREVQMSDLWMEGVVYASRTYGVITWRRWTRAEGIEHVWPRIKPSKRSTP